MGGETAIQRGLGIVFRALGALDLADRHWSRAQELALAHADAAGAAEAVTLRCELALLIGDYARTERLANELAQLAESASLPSAQGSAEEFLGVVARRHGQLDSGVAHEQRSLELQQTIGDQRGVARALSNLGTIARDRGDFAHALDLQLQSLAIREHIDENLELTLRNLALIYRDLGDDAATRKYFTRAIKSPRHAATIPNYSSTLGTYASYLVDVGNCARARRRRRSGRGRTHRRQSAFDRLQSARQRSCLDRSWPPA